MGKKKQWKLTIVNILRGGEVGIINGVLVTEEKEFP
jgi:hypothetical protein